MWVTIGEHAWELVRFIRNSQAALWTEATSIGLATNHAITADDIPSYGDQVELPGTTNLEVHSVVYVKLGKTHELTLTGQEVPRETSDSRQT